MMMDPMGPPDTARLADDLPAPTPRHAPLPTTLSPGTLAAAGGAGAGVGVGTTIDVDVEYVGMAGTGSAGDGGGTGEVAVMMEGVAAQDPSSKRVAPEDPASVEVAVAYSLSKRPRAQRHDQRRRPPGMAAPLGGQSRSQCRPLTLSHSSTHSPLFTL